MSFLKDKRDNPPLSGDGETVSCVKRHENNDTLTSIVYIFSEIMQVHFRWYRAYTVSVVPCLHSRIFPKIEGIAGSHAIIH